MPKLIRDLLAQLKPDPWRSEVGFSANLTEYNKRLFALTGDPAAMASVLNEWLEKYQPCLFGRIAAKLGLLEHCILTERDLQGSEAELKLKIQTARTRWTRDGFDGKKSGFVISVISPQVVLAVPDNSMLELAKKVCSLYLLEDVETDTVHTDELFLEKPGSERMTWMWRAGVNYFCAQGDGRWWHDHRIPGGFAFSVNSVGHMVKSGILARGMHFLNEAMGTPPEAWRMPKVDSLEKALELAMRTIALASETSSGRATQLLTISENNSTQPAPGCPVELPEFLRNKNYCEYMGYYHTDHTLPSVYFLPEVERTHQAKIHSLDFTYLFVRDEENYDFDTMAAGRPIRTEEWDDSSSGMIRPDEDSASKGGARLVSITSYPRLLEAIQTNRTDTD